MSGDDLAFVPTGNAGLDLAACEVSRDLKELRFYFHPSRHLILVVGFREELVLSVIDNLSENVRINVPGLRL